MAASRVYSLYPLSDPSPMCLCPAAQTAAKRKSNSTSQVIRLQPYPSQEVFRLLKRPSPHFHPSPSLHIPSSNSQHQCIKLGPGEYTPDSCLESVQPKASETAEILSTLTAWFHVVSFATKTPPLPCRIVPLFRHSSLFDGLHDTLPHSACKYSAPLNFVAKELSERYSVQ